MEKKKNIFLWGYYGSFNVGDDILLKTLVNKLSSHGNVGEITILCHDKENVKSHISGYKNINLITTNKSKINGLGAIQNFLDRVRVIQKNDIVIFGGGTSLFEVESNSYRPLLIKYLILLSNSLLFKREVIHLGVGIGSVNSKIGKWALKKILDYSDLFLFRDKISYERAISLSTQKNKFMLGSDLLLLNNPTFLKKNDNTNSKYKIGLSFFQYYSYISNEVEMKEVFLDQVVKLIKDLFKIQHGVEVYLFSFQKGMGGMDEEFNNKIMSRFENQKCLYHIKYGQVNDVMRNLTQMDLCIGMRYHFNLLSLFYGIEAIGISYQPKVYNEFRQLGLSDFCVEINEIEKIPDVIQKLNSEKLKVNYTNAFERMRKKSIDLQLNLDKVLEDYLKS